MGAGGPPHRALEAIRSDHAVSLHGVCMSIGAPQPLDKAHLARFRALVQRYEPALVSEHLAWSTHETVHFNDLLPLPYTEATLATVCDHIDEVQEAIGRPLLLENPSTYVLFRESTMSETDFIRAVARRTGCGLLLDVNNVFVSATNHGFSPLDYLSDYPLAPVGEIHLAGHAQQSDDEGDPLLIDSHDRPVADAVWNLFEIVVEQAGPIPTLIEWDSEIPEWPRLEAEATAAQAILDRAGRLRGTAMRPDLAPQATAAASPAYSAVFSAALLDPDRETPCARFGTGGQGRGEALQRLSQQRHGQPDRRAGGDLSGRAAHHRGRVLSRHGALSHPRDAADLAAAVRIRPRFSRLHRAIRICARHAVACRHGAHRARLARRLSRG